MSWGRSSWGRSAWGSPDDGPWVNPLSPVRGQRGVPATDTISIDICDRVEIDQTGFTLSVSDVTYVLNGVAQNEATVVYTPNDCNGVTATITLPSSFSNGDTPTVFVQATNHEGIIVKDNYSFAVGYGLRITGIDNPFDGSLVVNFNEPLVQNEAYFVPGNWVVTPVSPGAKPLSIVSVTGSAVTPQTAILRYVGGGSEYQLQVFNIEGLYGTPFEYLGDIALFEIIFGTQDAFDVTLFDTIFGPMGLAKRTITRRTMDGHTADLALALALDEQIRLRRQILDNTAGRDGRPGKLRG